MTQNGTKRTYTVGRGKPPTHSQFKPGQSGNPQGRPRGSVDFGQALKAAGREKVTITENGRQVRLTKLEVAVRQLMNKAASGHHPSIQLLARYGFNPAPTEPVAALPADGADIQCGSDEDMQVLEAFMQRLKTESIS